MPVLMPDESEDQCAMSVALTAALMVAQFENEIVEHPRECRVDSEAAATVFLLAQAGSTLAETTAYMRGEQRMD